jgi:hypothetical protein
MSDDGSAELCHVVVARTSDRENWEAKANAGDPIALLWKEALRNFEDTSSNRACACCAKPLALSGAPQTFLVFVPANDVIEAQVMGVCVKCSKLDDQWLKQHYSKDAGLEPSQTH